MDGSKEMKYEHLVVPEYFKLEDIKGSTLTKILHTEDWLNELRKVYKEDLNLFFDIRDELILRGFSFEKSIQNNLFPAKVFEPMHYVRVYNDNQNFIQLNTDVIGINHLIRRYHVQSDLFFNYITIEGIAHLVRKNSELITQYLKDSQFEIVYMQGKLNKITSGVTDALAQIRCVEDQKPIDQFNIVEKQIAEEQINSQPEEQYDYGSLNDVPIQELFFGGKFKLFVKFCAQNNITKISDINLDTIQTYSMQLGVGRMKASYVTSRYYELQQRAVKVGITHTLNNTIHLNTLESRIEYFCENDLKMILEANNISYLSFINDIYAEQNYNYINEKIEDFHLKLPELKENAQHKIAKIKAAKLREQILVLPVYEELMHFKWNVLVEILGIKLNQQEEMDGESHLYEIVQDEEWDFLLSELFARMEVHKPVKQAIAAIAESLIDREISILKLRSLNNTLEQVGTEFNVTRERVRQIEKRAINKIYNRLQLLKIDEYIRIYLLQEELVSLDRIISNLTENENSEIIIRYYINNSKSFEVRNNIMVDVELNNYIIQIVNTYEGDDKVIVFADELLKKLNENKLFEVTVGKLDFTLKNISYRRQNDIYIYKNVKLPHLIKYLFKYKLNEQPYELTDENFTRLNILMEKTFGIIFENGKRAAIARIRDTENIVLVDPNTFVYKDLDLLQQHIIVDIESKLNDLLSTMNTTTASTLYKKHCDTWNSYAITSPLYLYSIIQHHFSDQYQIGRGNTLSITRLDVKVENASEVLTNLLKKNNNVLLKRDILKLLHWPSYKLEQLVGRDPEFILVEFKNNNYGVRLFSSYNFTQTELEQMLTFTRKFITEEYIYTQDLMFEMEFDSDMSAILAEKNIIKLYDFASILKVLMPEFRGFHQFIYTLESDITVIEDAIFKEFPEILTRRDLVSFLKGKGYSESSYTSVISDLQEKKYFYPYTSVKYINSNMLNITEDILQEVKEYFKKVLTERDYISVYDLIGFSSLTKISEYQWQPNLLAALAKKIGYIVIDTTRDYRYNKLLIINPNLSITSIDELAYKLIREEYDGNYHETDVSKYLKLKKLTHAPSMPYAIKTSPLFEFNEYGFIKLLEV